MSEQADVRVPDMGSFKDVTVVDVLVKIGDRVELESPLATLETEKATMDVPSPLAGIVLALHLAKGDKINTGDRVVSLQITPGESKASTVTPAATVTPASAVTPTSAVTPASTATPASTVSADATVAVPATPIRVPPASPASPAVSTGNPAAHAGPSVRKLARELGVNLGQVTGSGVKARITHDDVKDWVKRALAGAAVAVSAQAALPRVPVVNFSAFGEVEIKPLTRVQKISGPRLHASWVNVPHVTQFDEADITELENLRTTLKQRAEQQGIKLTPLAFVVRACVQALAQFPKFRSSLDESGKNLVYKRYTHIGFAADTPNGLLVPVMRDADKRDVYEIARLLADLSDKARQGKLSAPEMQGGCFTISSLGGIGGMAFTPIINAPEVAILGVSRSSLKPVYRDGSFVPRLMLPLSLSYDHRVIDGAEAARFTTFLAQTLASPRPLLEALP